MLTLKQFVEEYKPLHNDICVVASHMLARLYGVAETDEDYYYIVKPFGYNNSVEWVSAVAECYSLRGILPTDKYQDMDEVFSLNGSELNLEFIIGENHEPSSTENIV